MSSLIPIESYATEADLQYALDLIDELKEDVEREHSNYMSALQLADRIDIERKHAEKTNEILRRTLNHKDEMLEFLR
jgi:hypothetical protein